MFRYIKRFFGKGPDGGKAQDTPNNSSVDEYIIRTKKGDVTARVGNGEIYLRSNELTKNDVEKVAEIFEAILTEYHRADIIKKEKNDKAKTYKKMDPQEHMNELMKDLNEENSPISYYKNYEKNESTENTEKNESTENTEKNEHVGYILLKTGNEVIITPDYCPPLTPGDLKSAVADLNNGVYFDELRKELKDDYGKYFHVIPNNSESKGSQDKKSQ